MLVCYFYSIGVQYIFDSDQGYIEFEEAPLANKPPSEVPLALKIAAVFEYFGMLFMALFMGTIYVHLEDVKLVINPP
jgi:hypothetical protein